MKVYLKFTKDEDRIDRIPEIILAPSLKMAVEAKGIKFNSIFTTMSLTYYGMEYEMYYSPETHEFIQEMPVLPDNAKVDPRILANFYLLKSKKGYEIIVLANSLEEAETILGARTRKEGKRSYIQLIEPRFEFVPPLPKEIARFFHEQVPRQGSKDENENLRFIDLEIVRCWSWEKT